PHAMQLTAVVRPEASGIAHFRFFARNQDGSFDSQRPSLEFTAHPEPPRLAPELPSVPEKRATISKELVPVEIDDQRWLAPNQRARDVREIQQVHIRNFALTTPGLS